MCPIQRIALAVALVLERDTLGAAFKNEDEEGEKCVVGHQPMVIPGKRNRPFVP